MQIRLLNVQFRINDNSVAKKLREIFGGGKRNSVLCGFVISDFAAGDLTQIQKQIDKHFHKKLVILSEDKTSIELFLEKPILEKLIAGNRKPGESGIIDDLISIYVNHERYESRNFIVDNKQYPMNTFYIMGILNVTPDSFSDGGLFYDTEKAIRHGIEMYDAGVDFIDIGGESTRPGADKVEVREEIKRVVPVIEGILNSRPGAIISIDTTKSKVAELALNAGAKIVNDISGLTFDDEMTGIIAKHEAAVVLMHIKGTPKTMQLNPYYDDPVKEIYGFFSTQINKAINAGIKNIIIDPGIGFGKRVKDNYEIIARLDEFKGLGYPILIGLSRKSFIGKALGLPVEERDYATLAAEQIAIEQGAVIVRTHNYQKLLEARKIKRFINNPNNLELANV